MTCHAEKIVSWMQVILKILQGLTDGVWTIRLAGQAMNGDLLHHHREVELLGGNCNKAIGLLLSWLS